MTTQSTLLAHDATAGPAAPPATMSTFERYLTLSVFACIAAEIMAGQVLAAPVQAVGRLAIAQVNLPVAAPIWAMIVPMLLKIDFTTLAQVLAHWRGIVVTVFVNWGVKPFSMALLGWIFVRHVFAAWLAPNQATGYIAGLILLAAAPCTAMVFVWAISPTVNRISR